MMGGPEGSSGAGERQPAEDDTMRCLWITRQDPRPANSGEFIYTGGLLGAVAAGHGMEITVLAHEAATVVEGAAGPAVRWVWTGRIPEGRMKSLASGLPGDAWRLGNPGARAALRRLLDEGNWDWVVVDHASCGWALDELERRRGMFRRLAHVSHNCERQVRAQVARESDAAWPMRLVLRWDAWKYGCLEERICRAADLITAITPADEATFKARHPGKRTLCLLPGYPVEPQTSPPPMDAGRPRGVVLAGAFEWLAKRRNLETFLEEAAKVFPAAGIGFTVVGKAPAGYFEGLAARFPWATFVANVPSVVPYLDAARAGVIPEALGGGFKLKALDYVFRGLPVAALAPAMSGLPMVAGVDAMVADSQAALAREIARRIDDMDFLESAARSAYGRCREAFRWADRGVAMAAAMRAVDTGAGTATG